MHPFVSLAFSPRALTVRSLDILRGQKLNPNIFFLKLFGRFRDIPAKSRDIPPKKFDSLGFEGHTELFGPHPFMWKTPTPPENIRTQKFRFGFFFSCLNTVRDPTKKTNMPNTCVCIYIGVSAHERAPAVPVPSSPLLPLHTPIFQLTQIRIFKDWPVA